MRRRVWIGLVLTVAALISALWFFTGYVEPPSEGGFRLVFLEGDVLLISDVDVVSYNLTNQEIAITDTASERLVGMGDRLYSFTGFSIRIDGEEVYHGVFRSAFMSAIPDPPKISILFPSILFPSEIENPNAIRMFYPWFEPPSEQPEANAKLVKYFEESNKLSY